MEFQLQVYKIKEFQVILQVILWDVMMMTNRRPYLLNKVFQFWLTYMKILPFLDVVSSKTLQCKQFFLK